MIKLAIFLESPSKEKHLHASLLSAFRKKGFSPCVVFFSGYPYQSRLPGKKFFLSQKETYKKSLNPFILKKLVSLLKKEKLSVIIVQRHRLLVYAVLSSFFVANNVKIVYHVQSTNVLRNRKRRLFFKLFSSRIKKIVAVSGGVKEYLLNSHCFPEQKVCLIYNGVNLQLFDLDVSTERARILCKLPLKEFLFGMAARFKRAKDHLGLIKAFSSFVNQGYKARLVLVGDGPTKKECEKLVSELSLGEKVIFKGWFPPEKIPVFLKAIDVFVHPSWREGIPTAVMEAMAARLPVITTDAEGLPDIFATKEHFGYMVPRGDTQALVQALKELYLLPSEERLKWGLRARKRIEEAFSAEAMGRNFVSLLEELFR